MKKSYIFYVTECAPNGTNDLLVCDGSEVIDSMNEALFGVIIRTPDACCLYGESISSIPEHIECAMEGSCDVFIVQKIDSDRILKKIAISPVCDGSKAEAFTSKYLK